PLAAAYAAGQQGRGDAVAVRALHHAGGAVGFAVDRIAMIEAGTDRAPTTAAGYQAVLAETLAAGIADACVRAELLAAGAAHRTARTDQLDSTVRPHDTVGAQVAAALANTARRACYLAAMADGVAARGA